MKFKHVVLFGVVASIMSYLNSVAETEEGNRQEKILDELQELLDVDMNELKVDQKTDKRIEKLEEVCKSFEGVQSSFAMQSGREVRVMVVPEKVSDLQAYQMAREIKEKIENEMTYPGQIKVSVVREVRATEIAK